MVDVDELAQEIRRVDGENELGAGQLAEALMPFLARSEWQDILTAPKNPPGEGVGPWVLAFSDWDHGRYQVRWECNREHGYWRVFGHKDHPAGSHLTHWMPLPQPPSQEKSNG